jgi:phosphoribosylaminoimidazolecarboxamide formyltransferase/IMP cyclohydrolase
VAVICNPGRYTQVVEELKSNNGALSEALMRELGIEVFAHTSRYDATINNYLSDHYKLQKESVGFPHDLTLCFEKIQELRYGENPHQRAAFYREKGRTSGIINAKQLQGKELSFNNILDLNAAFELVKEFRNPAAVIVKHNNPCGAAENKALDKAYLEAWKCDKLSAFGGIVALNRKMDLKTAKVVIKSGFLECVIAPGFDKEALELFKEKRNLRLLESYDLEPIKEADFKRVSGGLLLQDKDLDTLNMNELKVVTRKKPTKSEMESLVFAWKVAKHVKSNAIILCRGTRTVGIGAGQMSRVDSVFISTRKSGKLAAGSVMASDAFFPKEDAIQLAAKYKIKAIIQPGGSIADESIIEMADKHKIAMVLTGMRHFKH